MLTTEVKELTTETFADEIAEGVTLVDYWATWCGPCRMMHPVLDDLARRLGGSAAIAKVNVDEQPHLAAQAQVSAIPLLVLYKDGREMQRFVGLQSAQALHTAVQEAL